MLYRYTYNPPSDSFIETEIRTYWLGQGFQKVNVLKLTLSEKMKIGMAMMPVLRFTQMSFSFMSTLPFVTYRKLEIVDTSGNNSTKYVEARFVNGQMTVCEELDNYDI